jgi:hypothetical protein
MPRRIAAQPTDAFEALVCKHLGIQSLSPEAAKVLRETSQGDVSLGLALAEALCEMEFLMIGEDKQGKIKKFPLLARLRQEAITKFVAGLSTARPAELTVGAELTHKVVNVIQPILASQIIREIENL